jgi:hypothetical protein
VSVESDEPVPFERDESGFYHVTQPMDELTPESVSVTIDGTTYRFEDFQGRVSRSRIYPEVLAYGHCVKVTEDDGP